MPAEHLDQIVSLSKRRGFAYPGSEIYGGFANSYTYGPYGVELKNNLKALWWKTFVHNRPDVVGIDGDIILHPKTWHASGHVATFSDLLIDNKDSKKRYRADHLIEEQHGVDVEGWSAEKVNDFIQEKGLKCPASGSTNWTDARAFNLMFQTQMAKTGEDSAAYLRPETAQAIFLEYKNVRDSVRVKVPFGIAQMGKAFRNEITPGNFIFRRTEFEQMEIEYFIKEEAWEALFADWLTEMDTWCEKIGLKSQNCHHYEHKTEKLSHYSKRTVDIEFDFPFGKKELYGLSYRTDFDLQQHQKHSGKKLNFRDDEGNVFVPHVIEPSFGLDRSILAVLCSAYDEEILENGDTRTVLRLKPAIAPVKAAILPLMKKDGLPEIAKKIQKDLQILGNTEYDQGGAIGKRYRRQDEIGTPVCITVDYESKEDDSVTVRDRDTMEQKRIKIDELLGYLAKNYYND